MSIVTKNSDREATTATINILGSKLVRIFISVLTKHGTKFRPTPDSHLIESFCDINGKNHAEADVGDQQHFESAN